MKEKATAASSASPSASPGRRERVLWLCPSVWDLEAMAGPTAAPYQLSVAGDELMEEHPSLLRALRFDVFRYVRRLAERHRGAVDGIVGTGDYPGCMLAALLAHELGLPGPDPGVIVKLSHKFYSRQIQRSVIPEVTPPFEALDPFPLVGAPRPRALGYPVFIKPVKGTMSIRAQLVRDRAEMRRAVRFTLRERLEKYFLLRAFQQLLDAYTDGRVPAHHFVAEAPLGDVQVTVDGFADHGQVTIMGVVDSVMYPGTNSFERFVYPSRLPPFVQARMSQLAARLMKGSGFDQGCFNVEMFYDAKTDAVRVIEVNPRMSYQFADLYERVDGLSTFAIQLQLATGRPVEWKRGGGRDGAAASFAMRLFSDARVERVPSEAELAALAERVPGVTVKVLCRAGERLSEHDQDVGSWRYAIVNLSAPSEDELETRWREVQAGLVFGFSE